MLTGGLLAQLTAKDGREDNVEDLLRSARELAAAEEQTVAWFAPWISDHPYNDGSVRVRASQRRLSHRSVLGGERRISRVLLLVWLRIWCRAGARDAAGWHFGLDRKGRWLVAALSALLRSLRGTHLEGRR